MPSSPSPAVELQVSLLSWTCNTHTYTLLFLHRYAYTQVHTHTHTHLCMRGKKQKENTYLVTLYISAWECPFHTQTHMMAHAHAHAHTRTHTHTHAHTPVLRAIICHLEKNLQSCSLCWRLGLKAFLWKFMSKQLWSHPPLCGPWRQRCPRNYEGDPIHYTPPVSSWVCVYARVSHLLCVSLCVCQSVFLLSQCARSCLTPCVCMYVCVCVKDSEMVFTFSSLMAEWLSCGFMHRKPTV